VDRYQNVPALFWDILVVGFDMVLLPVVGDSEKGLPTLRKKGGRDPTHVGRISTSLSGLLGKLPRVVTAKKSSVDKMRNVRRRRKRE